MSSSPALSQLHYSIQLTQMASILDLPVHVTVGAFTHGQRQQRVAVATADHAEGRMAARTRALNDEMRSLNGRSLTLHSLCSLDFLFLARSAPLCDSTPPSFSLSASICMRA